MRQLAVAVLFVLSSIPAGAQLSVDQRVTDFHQLAALFAKRYAFIEWKRDVIRFEALDLAPWLDRVRAARNDLEFFEICSEYVARFEDGHSYFELPSYFEASLGFTADVIGEKILIDDIDRSRLSASAFPFEIGDELIALDGKSASEWIAEIARLVGDGNQRSARRSAASLLVNRRQYLVPRAHEIGEHAVVMIRRRSSGLSESYNVPWKKEGGSPYTNAGPVPTPRTTALPVKRTAAAQLSARGDSEPLPKPYQSTLQQYRVARRPLRAVAGYGRLKPVFKLPDNFVQRQGSRTFDDFYTGTMLVDGQRIGYLRIGAFDGFATTSLQTEIAFMQANTDGLVLDVMRNPGGLVCSTERLISYFTPDGYITGAHAIRATWDLLVSLEYDIELAREYGATAEEMTQLQTLLDDVRTAFRKERGFTSPLPLCSGSLYVGPAVDRNNNPIAYSKPLMVLIDETSASAAELFASALQDNKRAILYGMRTDGAGGTVTNHPAGIYSEASASFAQSIVVRKEVAVVPGFPAIPFIENIGVHPDILDDYMIEENFLAEGKPFVDRFLAAMVDYIKKSKN